MEIITGHINLDFDGFASMVAAKKLYPDAHLVLPNVVSKEVRNFLALYRSSLELKEYNEIDISEITKIIIVDTSSYSRVIDFSKAIDNPEVQVLVYDHHMEEDSDIRTNYSEIKKIGACTTIILNEVFKQGIKINPFEATIFALGIYSDTNCLTFTSTSVEDAKIVTQLLENGAYLDVVSEFVGQPLSVSQSNAFNKLIENLETTLIKGQEIGISAVSFDEYIDEVAYLTHRILSIKDYDAVFTIIFMKNRIYLVGRSTVPKINIDKIVKEFNGAGHPKAGSAIIKHSSLEEIKEKLLDTLSKSVEPSVSAKDIMTYPVKTVTDDISLKEANKIMLRYGHSGLPVVKNNEVVGIVTKKDVEKAAHHGYGHSPVKAYMSRKVVLISPDTPIKEIQHKFIENNVGRLPVVEDGKLVGIVTRTDILRQTFGEDSPSWYRKIYVEGGNKRLKKNFTSEIDNLPSEVTHILNSAGAIGDQAGVNIYVVGGFVRDLILGYDNLDIDIVVEGDGTKMAKRISEELNGKFKIYEKFQTAVVEVANGYKIDVVTARREFYEYPAALPTVEAGSIKSDLYRRDFTINSMAICLNKKSYGNLIDFFGGQKDLQHGLIRILYNMSFIEDPTRIYRAVRFEQRYGFKIEEQTFDLMKHSINSEVIEQVSAERLTDELMLVLKEKNTSKVLLRLNEIGLFNSVYPNLNIDIDLFSKIGMAKDKKIDFQLLCLLILFSQTDIESAQNVLEKIRLNKYYKVTISTFISTKNSILNRLKSKKTSNFDLYSMLQNISDEMLEALKILSPDMIIKNNIEHYQQNLRNKKLLIDGNSLKELGIKPGPRFKEIFEKVFEDKLNGKALTYDDEINIVKRIIK